MSTPFYTQVALDGYDDPDACLTVLLAAGITAFSGYNDIVGPVGSNYQGQALAWDGSNANQMRLAGAGDPVVARLKTVENRLVEGHNIGVAQFKFSDLMPIDPAATGSAIPVVGSTVKGGATPGTVQACTGAEAFAPTAPRVVEVRGTNVVVFKL